MDLVLGGGLKEVMGNEHFQLAVALVVLLLLVVVFTGFGWMWATKAQSYTTKKAEHYGNPAVITSAAQVTNHPCGLNRFGQGPSATNMGEYNQSLTTFETSGGKGKERLVNGRGEPDFWEISSELGAYHDEEAAHSARPAGSDYWDPSSETWMNADQVNALPADAKAQVQYYPMAANVAATVAANAAAAGASPAAAAAAGTAAAERLRNRSAERLENSNKLLSPEERMVSEMLAQEYRGAERLQNAIPGGENPALFGRAGVF
jgi:hypothetical protein